jgi:hypothetical protein
MGKCMNNNPVQEKRKRAFRRCDEFWALVNVLPALRLGITTESKKTDIIINIQIKILFHYYIIYCLKFK